MRQSIVEQPAHPVRTALIPELVWNALQSAFAEFGHKPFHFSVVHLFWSKIVLIPLVQGKSLARQAWSNFGGSSFGDGRPLTEQMWRLFPEEIPAESWNKLGVVAWPEDSRLIFFAEFAASYAALLHHVGHMADFKRLPDEIDDKGLELLQEYLNRESKRAEPVLQQTCDSFARLLNFFSDLSEPEKVMRPNLLECIEGLMGLKDAVMPTLDFNQMAKLDLAQTVEWKDRLEAAFGTMGLANLLWTSYVYEFPPYDH